MAQFFRYLAQIVEFGFSLLHKVLRLAQLLFAQIHNVPNQLRYILYPILAYLLFAAFLTYPFAYFRGLQGKAWQAGQLEYANERWRATAIYDRKGDFIGTFDLRLDSKQDLNVTGKPIILPEEDYIAPPDHKSIPVHHVPKHYWACLKYHEDRYIGTWVNPYGIDLYGVLKIPYTSLQRSIKARSIKIGVGGSTIAMQLVRATNKLTPHRGEGVSGKLKRKFKEWMDAPVLYRTLTQNGSEELLQRWAADHLPLAQRTGGQPLYGVEQAARVVFGKEARKLTIAEQYVLAGAVNRPIILLKGTDRLNEIRLKAWQRITKGRAHQCAVKLLKDAGEQLEAIAALDRLAERPPDPQVPKNLEATLKKHAPRLAKRAQANPILRANILAPAARYGARREMENIHGYDWRRYVRMVELTFNVAENLSFRQRVLAELPRLQRKYKNRIDQDFTLDIGSVRKKDGLALEIPDIIIAAANYKGEIVRYFESRDTAAYFGSATALNRETGRYEAHTETRSIASTGKMLAAIAIANQGKDNLNTLYLDPNAPAKGLESCARQGKLRRGRRAEVVFACSLSRPLEIKMAKLGQLTSRRLIQKFGFREPAALSADTATPPSTAIVNGFIAGSPQTVHHMAATILSALTGQGHRPLARPTLVRKLNNQLDESNETITPNQVISHNSHATLRALLSAPLCYAHKKRRHGTLKSLSHWCAQNNENVKLHIAKTGTQVTSDKNATVDSWAAGGIQFTSGRSYSYVVLVGTGNGYRPWSRNLHAAQIAAPMIDLLLKDLAQYENTALTTAQSAPPQRSPSPKRPQ